MDNNLLSITDNNKELTAKLEQLHLEFIDLFTRHKDMIENPNEKQVKAIETAAQMVLDTRMQYPSNSLADIYRLENMPEPIVKAHISLNRAVDLACRPLPFEGEAKRMIFLFELYEKHTSNLYIDVKPKRKR